MAFERYDKSLSTTVVCDNHLIDVFRGVSGQMNARENEILNRFFVSETFLPNKVSETIANGLVGELETKEAPTSPLAMLSDTTLGRNASETKK